MKKSTLALSIAAAIGGLGMVGAANAAMSVDAGGIGHQLVFPYFSAQGDNATLLSITNTDTTNGKLVKVRFRGAANSDDLFDFQLMLSPGDIWTAAVSKDAGTGLAKLATTDKSCTLPQSVNLNFGTARLDPSASAADKAAGTREGYVEVITMANIVPPSAGTAASIVATALFTTIKHKAGVAPCDVAVLKEKIGTLTYADLSAPTASISGDWIILNQTSTAAWSGSATALRAGAAANVVFYPQTNDAVTKATAATLTADPLLVNGIVAALAVDFPDMSTPYDTSITSNTPIKQADSATAALAVATVANQYVTDDSIAAVTDLLFSQPTRRYHVAVNYTARKDDASTTTVTETLFNLHGTKGSDAVAIFRNTADNAQEASGGYGSLYYNPTNIVFPTAASRTLCLSSLKTPAAGNRFDREETTPTTSVDFTISPVVVPGGSSLFICGEAAVVSINAAGVTDASALSSTVARSDITFPVAYTDGWVSFATPSASAVAGGVSGLPILGQAFIRAANGAVNYGFGYSHKTTK
jgi:hypothetical protein